MGSQKGDQYAAGSGAPLGASATHRMDGKWAAGGAVWRYVKWRRKRAVERRRIREADGKWYEANLGARSRSGGGKGADLRRRHQLPCNLSGRAPRYVTMLGLLSMAVDQSIAVGGRLGWQRRQLDRVLWILEQAVARVREALEVGRARKGRGATYAGYGVTETDLTRASAACAVGAGRLGRQQQEAWAAMPVGAAVELWAGRPVLRWAGIRPPSLSSYGRGPEQGEDLIHGGG